MSKALFIHHRNLLNQREEKVKLKETLEFISPDNISPEEPIIETRNHVSFGILNPKPNIRIIDTSFFLGLVSTKYPNWNIVGSGFPDGSFAIFRSNEQETEIISDASGSRTLWYYFDEDLLIASTSQFAIIKYLGNFQINENVIPWMLTTGTLGPDYSWDKRINKLPQDSCLKLSVEFWKIDLEKNEICFNEEVNTINFFENELDNTIKESILSLDIDLSKWVVPLSGGFDSRGILFYLNKLKKEKINTITWGLPSSFAEEKSDATIAKRLAEKLHTNHVFFPSEISEEPIDVVIKRFILNGEGRIDHISGYLDGFKLWKELHDLNFTGTIRGDQNFGWVNVPSEKEIVNLSGIELIEDFSNLDYQDFKIPISKQQLPEYLNKKQNETLSQWKDRLIIEFRLQSLKSALSDLKLGYLEQITPLLNKSILSLTFKHPDPYREEKKLWKNLIYKFDVDIPPSKYDAIANLDDILKQKLFVKYIKGELLKNRDNEFFTDDFLVRVLNKMVTVEKVGFKDKPTLKKIIKLFIPKITLSKIRNHRSFSKKLDYNKLAFRIYIILFVNNHLKTLHEK
ncbi:MAG: asparagine synthase-related protein [Mongoliitalea sp.]